MKKPNDLSIPSAHAITHEGKDTFFVIGDDRAEFTIGEHVAVAVNVNFLMRDGDKSRGHAITLHEIPLMRRLYHGGTIQIYPDWVPGLSRCCPLTRPMFEAEMKRLVTSYTIPGENGAKKVFAEVYGQTEADATRELHSGMKAIYDGWKALEKRALASFKEAGGDLAKHPKGAVHALLTRHITAEDLEALVALVEPIPKGLDSVKLESIEVNDGVQDEVGTNEDAPSSGRADLLADLMKAGFTKIQADELAVIAMEASIELPDEMLAQTSINTDGTVDPKLAKKARKVCAAWASRQKVLV